MSEETGGMRKPWEGIRGGAREAAARTRTHGRWDWREEVNEIS